MTPPTARWVRVGRDQIQEGTDLSLLGPTEDTTVVVYVICKAESINGRVRFRRKRMRSYFGDLEIRENRVLLEEPQLPISYARYAGRAKKTGMPAIYWVATVTGKRFMVEVIANTDNGATDESEIEAIARSLRLKKGAESCGAV